MRWRHPIVVRLAAIGLLAGCARSGTPGKATPAPKEPPAALSGATIVFAAASLTEGFKEIGTTFEQEHPGTTVTFNFGPSSGLAAQIIEGAPADVFASADQANVTKVVDADVAAGVPYDFIRNRLEIAVGAGNPKNIQRLADLAEKGVKVVLAAPQIPIGKYAAEALSKADVTVEPVSLEADVKAVATKVGLGEADAGIVYRTDVIAAGDKVTGVEIPEEHNVIATYPIVQIKGGRNPDAAKAFIAFVRSETGQRALEKRGFVVASVGG
jgi:molybdate transport system substrate-binding protein